ncbi:MAG: DUF2723 domain-containing protein [Bacteroidales bacterium]|jgi:hypothetical protein|nr:DUF2723 domain-containing protein [Bacteroidales bacterium]
MTNKTYSLLNNIVGWLVWAIASFVFISTAEKAGSWWDCGEYVSTAYKLMVGHPPGAPTFQIIGAIFALPAMGDTALVGHCINMMSALSSSFTILFLFWSITMLAKKIALFSSKNTSEGPKTLTPLTTFIILLSGTVGALAYTFSDSFWFSAVEGEVYAMSSFFTAITFWAILKWENASDKPHHLRWLVFISLLIGLAIGVHLLNLLVIPAIVFTVYFKKFKQSRKGFWYSLFISVILLGLILWGIVPYIVKLAGYFELAAVNGFGLPFNSGTIIYFVLLTGGIVWGLRTTRKKNKPLWNAVLLCFSFVLIGYSTFFSLVIRANENVPISQGETKDAISLLAYLNRDQYGTVPLFYGQYYNAPIKAVDPANPQYRRDEEAGRYIEDGYSSQKVTYDPRFCGLFPRIHSNMETGYRPNKTYNKLWSGKKDDNRKPTVSENMRFLFRYQIGWMYMRYFMWNFVGRQNDIMGRYYNKDGTRDYFHGNWISGIKFLDEARLGPQGNLPDELAKNPARNTFYFLPLLLGLIGLLYHFRRMRKDCFIVFLLFFMTGIAIVLYLNQPSTEPRERDYAFAGSFYAFAIWIGLGVMGLVSLLQKARLPRHIAAILAVSALGIPCLMAQQGWNDHDRSLRTAARDFGRNMLESCPPNAVLIVDGDNDTFPVWYCQQVEGIRTDVRVINSMLTHSSWAIQPLYRRVYESAPLKMSLKNSNYYGDKNTAVFVQDKISTREDARELLSLVNSDNPATKLMAQSGEKISFFPTRNIKIPVPKSELAENGIYTAEELRMAHDTVVWNISTNQLTKSDLALFDIFANNAWERPMCFSSGYAHQSSLPSVSYGQIEGSVTRIVPYSNPNRQILGGSTNGIASDRSYHLLMNVFDWGALNSGKIELDPETRSWSGNARSQYLSLAAVLFYEGKIDSCVNVLDKGLFWFPNDILQFDDFTIQYARFYYMAGANGARGTDNADSKDVKSATEKGRQVLLAMADTYTKKLKYLRQFPVKMRRDIKSELDETVQILRDVYSVASQNNEKEIADMIKIYEELQQN